MHWVTLLEVVDRHWFIAFVLIAWTIGAVDHVICAVAGAFKSRAVTINLAGAASVDPEPPASEGRPS